MNNLFIHPPTATILMIYMPGTRSVTLTVLFGPDGVIVRTVVPLRVRISRENGVSADSTVTRSVAGTGYILHSPEDRFLLPVITSTRVVSDVRDWLHSANTGLIKYSYWPAGRPGSI